MRVTVCTSSPFWTLPIELRGSSSTTWNAFGTLKRARRSRQCARSSSSATGAREHDERDADLAPALVGHADDRGVGDRRVLVQHGLDLGRVDVLAAGDDQLLQPAADPVVALVVALGDVAGQQPAVAERGRGRLVVAPVAGEDVRAAHEQLALAGRGRTRRTGTACRPQPALRRASSGGRQSTFGAASVRP